MNKDFGKMLDPVLKTVRKIEIRFSNLFDRFRSKKLTVQTEVKGAEKVEEAKQKLESLPATKTVEVQVEKTGDLSGLSGTEASKAIPAKPEVPRLPAPPVGPWSKMNGIFQSLRSGVHNFASGLKHASDVFISSGGGAMVLIEGFKSLINIGKHFYGEWINGMKEAAEMSENNASSIREAAQANEELRQKGDSYLAQLEQIASQESLSNANKAEAKKAIGELTKAYGDLGIKLDETTGKLTGVDSAMIKKAEKDKSRRIKELNAELKELQNANQQQAEVRDKAGVPVWFGGKYRIGGKETIEAAGKAIAANNDRIAEIMRERKILMDSDPAGELRSKKQAETARQEEEFKRRQRAFEDRKHDDAFASETDPAKKIVNRQFLLDRHQREVLDPLQKKIAAAEERVKNTTGDDQSEARRNLIQLKKEQLTATEKTYVWQKQIDDIRQKSGSSLSAAERRLAAGEDGRNDQKPNRSAKEDPGTARNQGRQTAAPTENPGQKTNPPFDHLPVQNNKKTDPPEINQKPEAGKQTAAAIAGRNGVQNGQVLTTLFNSSDKAQDLKYRAMEMAGKGKEASEQRALRDAERTKGSKLTEEEIAATKKLHELTWQLDNMRAPDFGDISIKTNNLTSRGGFQTGASAPDADKYNRIIADNGKTMLSVVQRIETICREFGKF